MAYVASNRIISPQISAIARKASVRQRPVGLQVFLSMVLTRSVPRMVIPHYAAISFAGSRSGSHAGRLRNDLVPRIRQLRAPICAKRRQIG